MAPREGPHGRAGAPAALVVRVAFEPSRIARARLAQAYTVAVPVVRRPAVARFVSRGAPERRGGQPPELARRQRPSSRRGPTGLVRRRGGSHPGAAAGAARARSPFHRTALRDAVGLLEATLERAPA